MAPRGRSSSNWRIFRLILEYLQKHTNKAKLKQAGKHFLLVVDDIRSMALSVLDHRIVLRPESEIEGVRTQEVLESIFREIPVPR